MTADTPSPAPAPAPSPAAAPSSPGRTVVYTTRVEFGDCDPAGIVWYPNFFGWLDAASRHFFAECGVPRWEETTRTLGVIGTPIVDTQARFLNSASYGDTLHVAVQVREWRAKSFVLGYRVTRPDPSGETPILECQDVRIFGGKHPDGRLRALPVPPEIRTLCE